MFFIFYSFISALDSKAPKAEDIEEEDDDVPGMDHQVYESQITTCIFQLIHVMLSQEFDFKKLVHFQNSVLSLLFS